jgi:hypothetical protein
MKKRLSTIGLLTFSILLIMNASGAGASQWPAGGWDGLDLASYLNTASVQDFPGGFGSAYEVAPLAYEAADTDNFFSAGGSLASTNNVDLPSNFLNFVLIGDLRNSYFVDHSVNPALKFFVKDYDNTPSNQAGVRIYELLQDWTTIPGASLGQMLSAGALIIGFNDIHKDGDSDDLIIAARKVATPVPAAVWLLGSGVIGLLGVRGKNGKRHA